MSTIAIRLWVVGADTNAEADAALIASATRDVFFMVGSMRVELLGIFVRCGNVVVCLSGYYYVLLQKVEGNNFLWCSRTIICCTLSSC